MDFEKVKKYFEDKKTNTEWVDSFIKESSYIGCDDAPMLIREGEDENSSILTDEIGNTVTTINAPLEYARNCASSSLLFMKTPYHDRMEVHPVKMCAIQGLYFATDFGCPAMNSFAESRQRTALGGKVRAEILNLGIEIQKIKGFRMAYNKATKEIRAIHTQEYLPLPEVDLLETFEKSGIAFSVESFFDSDEFSNIVFKITDESVINGYNALVQGSKWEGTEPCVSLTTSDCGFDSVTLTIAIKKGNKIYALSSDKTAKIKHTGNYEKKMADFDRECKDLYKSFTFTVNELDRLKKIPLQYPINAFRNIAVNVANFSKKDAKAYAESGNCFPTNGFELYTELFNLCKKEEGLKSLKEMENIAKVFSTDFSYYDVKTLIEPK